MINLGEETPTMMIVHSFLIGCVLYLIMTTGMKQDEEMAQTRTVLASALILAYMMVFGHKMPSKANLNPKLF